MRKMILSLKNFGKKKNFFSSISDVVMIHSSLVFSVVVDIVRYSGEVLGIDIVR
jgi:hypothetical protein